MTLALDSWVDGVLFWVVFLAGIGANSLTTRKGARASRGVDRKVADPRSSTVVNAANASSFLISLAFGYFRIAALPDWTFAAGLAVFLLGISLSTWAAIVLGRFYSPMVDVQSDHRLVEQGPYRLIRHPFYAGAIVAFLGIALALQSWMAALVALIVNGLGYAYRIRVEERFMRSELGDVYVEYCSRTKCIVPFLL